MSSTVDQRVVEMRFDNRQFESNVSSTMSTLDKLKQKLNLTGAAKGIEEVGTAAKKTDLSPLGASAEAVAVKFSYMQATIQHQINQIVDHAVSAGKKIVSALTIDPIKTGFQEYELKMGSIQTILANTQHAGTTLDDVVSALNELNLYADKTIYNFQQMTKNVGTFTAAGVDLDKSVKSIQGIANLAAVSGSTSDQASRAMYQLSQALSAGRVTLMDWNSVVNAGMGGKVFQDALIRTAAAMKGVTEETFRAENITTSFRDSISSRTGESWLSSEVLTQTLVQFTMAAEEGSDEWEKFKKSLMETGYTEDQAVEILKMANTATDAATKVKTFTQLWDTLKESAQSGWAQTWELIIGDFEEAKEFLTGLSDLFGGILNDSANRRNTLFGDALNSNWDKLILSINEAGIATKDFENNIRALVGDDKLDSLIAKHGNLEKAVKNGAISADILKKALNSVGEEGSDSLSKITETLKFGDSGEGVKQMQQALIDLGYELDKYGADGNFNWETYLALKDFQKANDILHDGICGPETLNALKKNASATGELTEANKELAGTYDDLIDGITQKGGRELFLGSLMNIIEAIHKPLSVVGEEFRNMFSIDATQIYSALESFNKFTESLIMGEETTESLRTTFKGFFSLLDIGWTFIKDIVGGIASLVSHFTGLGGGILGVTAYIGEWITNTRDAIKEGDAFGKAIDKIVGFLGSIIDEIKNFGKSIKESFSFGDLLQDAWNVISKISTKIGSIFAPLVESIRNVFSDVDLGSLFNSSVVSGMIGGVFLLITKLTKPFSDIMDSLVGNGGLINSVTRVLDSVRGCFEAYQNSLNAEALKKIATAIAILAAGIFVISSIDSGKLDESLGAVTVLFAELLGSLAIFSKLPGEMKGVLKACGLMIGMGVAITILAGAMRIVSTLNWDQIGKGLVTIGILMGELALFLEVYKFEGKLAGVAFGMILLSAAIVILSKAVEVFGAMDWDPIGKGLFTIGVLLGELALFTQLTGNASKMISTGAGLVLIAASMTILAYAMKDFGAMKPEEIGKGLLAMGAALGVMVAALNFAKGTTGGAASIVIAVGALALLVPVLKAFGSMKLDEIKMAFIAMGGALAALAIGLTLMTGTLSGAAALIIAAGALAIIAPVMKFLGTLSWEHIGKGLVAIAGAFTVVGVAGLLLAPLTGTILALAAAFALFGVAALGIGAGLTLIGIGIGAIASALAVGATAIIAGLTAIVKGVVDLLPTVILGLSDAILALCTMLRECSPAIVETIFVILEEVCRTLETYVPLISDALYGLMIGALNVLAERMPELLTAVINVVEAFFVGVADAFNGIDTTNLLKGVVGVAILTAIMYALGSVVSFIPGAIAGVLGMGVIIAELALVLAAVGALAQIPGLNWLIGEGGDLLQNIGTAIGQFVGGIVAGVAEGATSTLPQVATNLSDFMTNLQPFTNGAAQLDPSILSNVETLAGVILTLTGAGLLDAITSWISGGSSLSQFAEDLVPFGTAMKNFATEVTGLDTAAISASVAAAESLVAVAQTIPSDGFLGLDGIDDFGKNIVTFGKSIKGYAAEVTGLDTTAVATSVQAAKDLVAVAGAIPEDGTFGTDGIDDFGKNIATFGEKLQGYAAKVAGLDTVAISMSIIGARTISTFIKQLAGFDSSVIDNFKIDALGTAISNYSTKIAAVDTVAITASVAAAMSLKGLVTSLAGIDTSGVATFSSALEQMANVNVSGFVSTFQSASTTLRSVGTNMMQSLISGIIIGQVGVINTASMTIDQLSNAISVKLALFQANGLAVMTRFVAGMNSQRAVSINALASIARATATRGRSYYSSFYSAGQYMTDGFAKGIRANEYKATAAGRAIARAAYEAAKRELDERSPSKVMYGIGDFAGQGFVNALFDYASKARDAGAEMASSAKTGLAAALTRVGDLVSDNLNAQPTIRPVLDLSQIQNGVGQLNGLFTGHTMDLAVASASGFSGRSGGMNSSIDKLCRLNETSNHEVVSAIAELRGDFSNLVNAINGIHIRMDSGAVVGELIGKIDRGLGQIAMHKGRGS